jgi:uncharacterized phage-associated protein
MSRKDKDKYALQALEWDTGEAMATCYDVANHFLALGWSDDGELISNLKLQKLVYYAQGFVLAILDRALFPEAIEAWDHGPVVPDLYHHYKQYGATVIPPPEGYDPDVVLSVEEQKLLNDVYLSYGQYTAWKLRDLSHEESPWKDAYARGSGTVITPDSMKSYFRENLIEPTKEA